MNATLLHQVAMEYRRAFVPGATYFFTVVTEQRRALFDMPTVAAMLMTEIDVVKTRHPFDLCVHVILPDHLHMLWILPEGDTAFPMSMRLIKDRFTRAYLKLNPPPPRSASRLAKQEQAVWQRRYWEHVIRDQDDFNRHADDIHYNPVRHGLAESARDWPHSSFADWVARDVYSKYWGSDDMPPLPAWMTATTTRTDM